MNDVSFIIVCYNQARYANRVARFLRAQEGVDDAEYIFIDDGSTDGTAEAIEKATAGWGNTLIYRQENAGPSNAMNQGLRRATRPYAKLVGGDDLLHPQATVLLREQLIARNAVYAFGRFGGFNPSIAIDDEAYWSALMPRMNEMDNLPGVLIDDPQYVV